MIGIVLALLSSLSYSLSMVLVRKRLDESNSFSVALVITVIGNVILWPLVLLFVDLRTVDPEGILFFALAGILALGIGRLLYFEGMDVVGAAVNASVISTYPIYSSTLGVLLLKENLTIGNWVGIVCILIGVVFIQVSLSGPKTGLEKSPRKGLVLPVIAAATFASASILRKQGLNVYGEPLLGVAIGYSLALLLYLVLSCTRTAKDSLISRKSFRLFWKAGVCTSLGWILGFYALSYEKVSIVAPVTQTHLLFVLIFAYLYLKELEYISSKLVISALLIVMGAVLVTIH